MAVIVIGSSGVAVGMTVGLGRSVGAGDGVAVDSGVAEGADVAVRGAAVGAARVGALATGVLMEATTSGLRVAVAMGAGAGALAEQAAKTSATSARRTNTRKACTLECEFIEFIELVCTEYLCGFLLEWLDEGFGKGKAKAREKSKTEKRKRETRRSRFPPWCKNA